MNDREKVIVAAKKLSEEIRSQSIEAKELLERVKMLDALH